MEIALVYLALLAVAFFFLIVRPQRRQLAARQTLIASIEVGDEIITAGGIYGTVLEADESTMQVEVAPGTVLTVAREAVARRREEPGTGSGSETDGRDEVDLADGTAGD